VPSADLSNPSLPSAPLRGSYKPQKKFTTLAYNKKKRELLSSSSPTTARALRENDSSHMTHAWMTVYGKPQNEHADDGCAPRALSPESFRMCFARRHDIVDAYLGHLLTKGAVCCGKCGTILDATMSLHLSDCVTKVGGQNTRHNSFVNALVRIITEAKGETPIRDGKFRKIGIKPKQPDITIADWEYGCDLALDVIIGSVHVAIPMARLLDPTRLVDPDIHSQAVAHCLRIRKLGQYVKPERINASMLNDGSEGTTPEEKRTLKKFEMSDHQGNVLFLPIASSSGGAPAPDLHAFLRTLASTAVRYGRLIDKDPIASFLNRSYRRLSVSLMRPMASNMRDIRSFMCRPIGPNLPEVGSHIVSPPMAPHVNLSLPPSSFPNYSVSVSDGG
jgi:hypothetical protein